ncbi:hypothetical protein TIFTF001_025792 [Ficus carica]|uniref:Uncharacterized protein n=1 Tax=Ficus carica TaxID=3494 RepID=A0AA88APB0_FICCA|nr:hypothetical protein TIFTF001_025792 [Ficus carica]
MVIGKDTRVTGSSPRPKGSNLQLYSEEEQHYMGHSKRGMYAVLLQCYVIPCFAVCHVPSYDASYAKNNKSRMTCKKRKKEGNKLSGDKSPVSCPPSEVGLSYGKSKSIVARRVSNLQAVADTRWRSMAGRTVKCGKFRYAFRSF